MAASVCERRASSRRSPLLIPTDFTSAAMAMIGNASSSNPSSAKKNSMQAPATGSPEA
jgi:hypothetical protein